MLPAHTPAATPPTMPTEPPKRPPATPPISLPKEPPPLIASVSSAESATNGIPEDPLSESLLPHK